MITQDNIRSILPGKITRTVMILADRANSKPLEILKKFYLTPTYRELEREESKYWWMSPEQLACEVEQGVSLFSSK